VCALVYSLLHQESFDMILATNPSYQMGVSQLVSERTKVKCMLTSFKMTNNIFTVRNIFCPYKEYSSFLGGKLTMFNLCNYAGQGKSCDFFRLF
jgi:hypothetical protein